jgi:uncharacterized protein YfiM (DUF2279 family)
MGELGWSSDVSDKPIFSSFSMDSLCVWAGRIRSLEKGLGWLWQAVIWLVAPS